MTDNELAEVPGDVRAALETIGNAQRLARTIGVPRASLLAVASGAARRGTMLLVAERLAAAGLAPRAISSAPMPTT